MAQIRLLPSSLLKETISVVVPFMATIAQRQAYFTAAFPEHENWLRTISWNTDPEIFSATQIILIHNIMDCRDGEHPVSRLLDILQGEGSAQSSLTSLALRFNALCTHEMSVEARPLARLSRSSRIRLVQLLSTRFDVQELSTFCGYLQVDFTTLDVREYTDHVRELINKIEQEGKLDLLVSLGERLRPDIAWRDLLVVNKNSQDGELSGEDREYLLSYVASADLAIVPRGEVAIFLSSYRKTQTIVRELQSKLTDSGYQVRVDNSARKGSAEWVTSVAMGIVNTDVLIALVSADPDEGEIQWLEMECLYALRIGKPIVPILVDDCSLPRSLASIDPLSCVKGLAECWTRLEQRLPTRTNVNVVPDTGAVSTKVVRRREAELKYLDELLLKHLMWQSHYTPMAGVAHVNNEPPPLARGMYGVELDTHYEQVFGDTSISEVYKTREKVKAPKLLSNVIEAIHDSKRLILLGEPGSGKTTTLWRITSDYALGAKEDPFLPLPCLINLGSYTDNEPFIDFVTRQVGSLYEHFHELVSERRAFLLLDGLNEIPLQQRSRGVKELLDLARHHLDLPIVITCRELDFPAFAPQFEWPVVKILPLDAERILQFSEAYLGREHGSDLFWQMAGLEARRFWSEWQREGLGDFRDLWSTETVPRRINNEEDDYFRKLRLAMRGEGTSRSLLVLARNPYMLFMISQVYRLERQLPINRGQLFDVFVNVLLRREKFDSRELLVGLGNLAFYMQNNKQQVIYLRKPEALTVLKDELILEKAARAHLLSDGSYITFTHQLLQEYFAARRLEQELHVHNSVSRFIPSERWWEPHGWEETIIILAGLYSDDCSVVLDWVKDASPILTARCIAESGAYTPPNTRKGFQRLWLRRLHGNEDVKARAAIGRALSIIGDPRPGILCYRPVDRDKEVNKRVGLVPDISWSTVLEGEFVMGSTSEDRESNGNEYPQHQVYLDSYNIGKYPITNAQYGSFLNDEEGYADIRWWTEFEQERKWNLDKRAAPSEYGYPYTLDNHPRVGVSWYEALAFCRWLTWRLKSYDALSPFEYITLPTEEQWEKAARGIDGRKFPWGDKGDVRLYANSEEASLHFTSAVGMFPQGKSVFNVWDCSGNIWEWTASKWRYNYEEKTSENTISVEHLVARGGACNTNRRWLRCASRLSYAPHTQLAYIGFRVVLMRDQVDRAN